MSEKQFVVESRDEHLFTVRDTVNEKQVICLEFNSNETLAYLSFMQLIQLMNDLADENRQLNHDYTTCKINKQINSGRLKDLERIIIDTITRSIRDVDTRVYDEKSPCLEVRCILNELRWDVERAFRNFRELEEIYK